jgi:hypothetical protein
MKPTSCSSDAVAALEREALAALTMFEVLRRYPSLAWLADATDARLLRLGSAIDSARRGWPLG